MVSGQLADDHKEMALALAQKLEPPAPRSLPTSQNRPTPPPNMLSRGPLKTTPKRLSRPKRPTTTTSNNSNNKQQQQQTTTTTNNNNKQTTHNANNSNASNNKQQQQPTINNNNTQQTTTHTNKQQQTTFSHPIQSRPGSPPTHTPLHVHAHRHATQMMRLRDFMYTWVGLQMHFMT